MGKNYTYSLKDTIYSIRLIFILTITFFITVLISSPLAAQQKISEINSYISTIEDSNKTSELESLVYNVQPTVYLNNGTFDPKGEGAMRVASVNANEIEKLKQGHGSLQSVRLLLISFKDLQELQAFRLQPANIGSMPNLAYVILSLGFEGAPAEMISGIQGFDESEIVFLFESAKPF